MKIIIVGIGKVGMTLASALAAEHHDVVLIDYNESILQRASDTLDVMCVRGNGASVAVLRSAGLESADVLIAATGVDEFNMLCCLTAKRLGVPYTVARIRNAEYAHEVETLKNELEINLVVNPEQATASQISRLLRFPEADDIETFYKGRIELIGFKINNDELLIGNSLAAIRKRLSNLPVLFCALDHDGSVTIPNGSTVFQNGDKIYVIGESGNINRFFKAIGRSKSKIKNAMIIGGGRIGGYLAKLLHAANIDLKIIEKDPAKCIELAENLPYALIVNGNGTDQELLNSENIGLTDAFIAVTGDDEENLITSVYAKQVGAKKVIAKINRQNYFTILESLPIDSVISPKVITAYNILRNIRGLMNSKGSRMEALYKIANEKAEAMEFIISSSTHHLNKPLKELPLKSGILIAVIVRNDRLIVPEGNDVLMENDDVIIISSGKQILDINDIFNV